MKKFKFSFIIATMSVLLISCNNNSVTAEEGGIQIDPELKELGELNALLLQYDDVGDKFGDCIAVKSKKKWGLINLKGDTILDFNYVVLKKDFYYDFWGICNKTSDRGYSGLANVQGKLLCNPDDGRHYKTLSNDYYVEDGKELYTLYNKEGEEVFIIDEEEDMELPAYDINCNSHGLFMVRNGDKWYMAKHKDSKSSIITFGENGYSDYRFANDSYVVKNEEGKWGAINNSGEVVVPFEYLDVKMNGNGNAFIQNEEGKWCVFNGKDVSSCYDDLFHSIDDYSIGKDGDSYVILDKYGKELFKTNDSQAQSFYSNGMFLGKHCVYDLKGNKVVSLNDSLRVVEYVNGYIVVGVGSDNFGIVDKEGKFVVPVTKYIYPYNQKGSPMIRLKKNISDEVVNGKRIIINITDVFNTEKGTLYKTQFDLNNYKDGLAFTEVEGKHIFVNGEGKTGIVNLDDILKSLAEKKEQSKMQEQEEGLESIKKQLVETINKENGREILSGTYAVHDLKRLENGTYRAEFYDKQVYETFTYEIFDIKVDDDYNVLDFDLKVIMIKPHANKPDGGIKTVEEVVRHAVGAVGY